MQKVLFIGLGNMGGPMAANLVNAGLKVTGYDLNPKALAELVKVGGLSADNIQDVAVNADVIITMLPTSQHVKELYFGVSEQLGLIDLVTHNTLLIDCSTIDAETARAVAIAASQKDIAFVDAPVSGGTAGAAAGSLTFICGGDDNAFVAAKPVLEKMGSNIFHAGSAGAGQIAKICNNMLLSVLMIGTSEALSMGIDNGLDPKVLSNIMKVSSGGNWTLDKYNPCPNVMEAVPASKDYQGGFMVDLMVKDLGLAMDAALNSQSSTPMGSLARNLYVNHARDGHGKRDFSSIFEQFQLGSVDIE